MIIFPIDDVCDLKLGKSVKFYNSRKNAGAITNIYTRLPSMAPFVTIDAIAFFRNGFAYYNCGYDKQIHDKTAKRS